MHTGRLHGKVALITGVAKTDSIGFATAPVFGEEGAALAIADISDHVHECAKLLRDRGSTVSAHTADLTGGDQVRRIVAEGEDVGGLNTAMGRSASPEEVARAIPFPASDDASNVTGQLLIVDGGNTIQDQKGPSELYY